MAGRVRGRVACSLNSDGGDHGLVAGRARSYSTHERPALIQFFSDLLFKIWDGFPPEDNIFTLCFAHDTLVFDPSKGVEKISPNWTGSD